VLVDQPAPMACRCSACFFRRALTTATVAESRSMVLRPLSVFGSENRSQG
jgi:hypothetical protein